MNLTDNLSINSVEYATQGNAILGIRKSGKSYTATYIAERLMDEGIPFIAFDPIGVWRYLKQGVKGAGYPVVVAGEKGDLPLTAATAPAIVRAAMKENVSLVVDLYSIHLSKKDWRHIVEESIRLLQHENKDYGVRHIFIEEAAEFVPQRIPPEYGRVYAEIEKLSRMGGNASLGYTLINQRAEEVNKAVLENCDFLVLHRQKGRNSLTALKKWLDITDVESGPEIIKSLPSLGKGECWVWGEGSHTPVRIKVPEKKTVHPDRDNPLKTAVGISSDVSSFVSRMDAWLVAQAAQNYVPEKKGTRALDQSTLIHELQTTIKERDHAIRELNVALQSANAIIEKISNLALPVTVPSLVPNPGPGLDKVIIQDAEFVVPEFSPKLMGYAHKKPAKTSSGNGTVPAGPMKILVAAAMFFPSPISKKRMAILSGVSYKKSTFRAYIAQLKQNGWLETVDDSNYRATKKGLKYAGPIDAVPATGNELIEFWCSRLGEGPSMYLRTLAKRYPRYILKEELAAAAGKDYTKSTHRAYMAELKAMGLVEVTSDAVKLVDELYE